MLAPETAWVFLPPLGAMLWSAGGTWWKPLRRWGYPLLLVGVLAALGTIWWRWLLTAISTSAAAHLGYGEASSWRKRWLVGLALACSSWPLAVGSPIMSWYTLSLSTALILLTFTGGLWLSQTFSRWTHKITELCTGFVHASVCLWWATVR